LKLGIVQIALTALAVILFIVVFTGALFLGLLRVSLRFRLF
jgi:hypothetical protein